MGGRLGVVNSFMYFPHKKLQGVFIDVEGEPGIEFLLSMDKWGPKTETIKTNPYTPLGGLSVPEHTTYERTQMFWLRHIAIAVEQILRLDDDEKKIGRKLDKKLSEWLEKQ